MGVQIPADVLEALERLGAQTSGDVPGLVESARAVAPGPFASAATLAGALEQAAHRRAAAGDRTAAWWLACAIATVRASPIASAQEDAEVVAARILGELPHSPAAVGPLPQGARWIVSGAAEPAPSTQTLELARRNATTYVERLDAELAGRAAPLRAKWDAAPVEATRVAIEEALSSYATAAASTRGALSRVVDHVVARSGDAALAQAGEAALAELDDVVLPGLLGRIDEARAALGSTPAPAPHEPMDRPSFAGAAPPVFHHQSSAPAPVSHAPSAPSAPSGSPSLEQLDAAMRAAFERAWADPAPAARQAFEQAVRARYEHETASIPDPAARQQALDHYVAHALAQLPARA